MTDDAARHYWGRQTDKALANVGAIAGRVAPELVHAIVAIKIEAAAINSSAGVITGERAAAIASAGEEVLNGSLSDQFPLDVFQTGSGTSTNMNVNEVLARRAAELGGIDVHPNDHVNASQSSNDVFPSAIRIAALCRLRDTTTPALEHLRSNLMDQADRHSATVKLGRTHLMDAVPMTFGQELGGWARSVELATVGLIGGFDRLHELPLGGTAVGTGLNAPAGFGAAVTERLAARFALPFREATNHFESQSGQEALSAASATCRTAGFALNKIAGDLRLLGSGPTSGLGEVIVPNLQAGSSIMPGKVNPVILEVVQQIVAQVVGNDAAIAFATTNATLQLTTAMPLMANCLLSNLALCGRAAELLADKQIASLEVDSSRMHRYATGSPALTTALAPTIGYDRAALIARAMIEEGLTVDEAGRRLLGEDEWAHLAPTVDPTRLARPHSNDQ